MEDVSGRVSVSEVACTDIRSRLHTRAEGRSADGEWAVDGGGEVEATTDGLLVGEDPQAARLGRSGQLSVQKPPGGRPGLRHPDAAPPARDYETDRPAPSR